MKPIWSASEHVEGPNEDDIYTAGIDTITQQSFQKTPYQHWNAVEFHGNSHHEDVVRDCVLNLMWASGKVEWPLEKLK